MDVWLLGAAAIVLIAITLWIVWPSRVLEGKPDVEDSPTMIPQGDKFEDQYTSATADLSAGGVAITEFGEEDQPVAAQPEPTRAPEPVAPAANQTRGEPWSAPTVERERTSRPLWLVGAATAALMTAAGAWWYRRRQHHKNRIAGLKRRLFR